MDTLHYYRRHMPVDIREDFLEVLQMTIPQELSGCGISIAEIFVCNAVIFNEQRWTIVSSAARELAKRWVCVRIRDSKTGMKNEKVAQT